MHGYSYRARPYCTGIRQFSVLMPGRARHDPATRGRAPLLLNRSRVTTPERPGTERARAKRPRRAMPLPRCPGSHLAAPQGAPEMPAKQTRQPERHRQTSKTKLSSTSLERQSGCAVKSHARPGKLLSNPLSGTVYENRHLRQHRPPKGPGHPRTVRPAPRLRPVERPRSLPVRRSRFGQNQRAPPVPTATRLGRAPRVPTRLTAAWVRFLEISKLAAEGPNINDYRGSAGVEGDLCVSCRRRPELAPSPVRQSDVCGTLRAFVAHPG